MNIEEIVKITGGKLLSGDPAKDVAPSSISTDSRTIKNGEFFIALNGANFRGSDFVEASFKKGAVGAIAEDFPPDVKKYKKIAIKVKDTTTAFQDIARHHRMKFGIPVIAVTGSNGKTTVKEMIACILSREYNVLKNEGTKNNQIGVPQTLLKLKRVHEACILELGTSRRGEIRNLSYIARPDICVITNIGPSHLEFLGDLKGVYEAKKEILEFLNGSGVAVLNGDDKFLSKVKGGKIRIIKFGLGISNDFRADHISIERDRSRFRLNNKEEFELRLLGLHNIYNALAAIAVSRHFGVNHSLIRKAISGYRPVNMRLEVEKIGGFHIVNDSYNSNPMSMKAALEAIKHYPAKAKWIVAGDMLELGKNSADFHRMIGALIADSDFKGLLTFGELSKHILRAAMKNGMKKEFLWHCATHDEIADILKRILKKDDMVLLKGSRSMKMEEVVNKLRRTA